MKNKGRVAGATLNRDLVRLRREAEGEWRNVVVDVKITSADKMNETFVENDEKCRQSTTKETWENKVGIR